MNPLSLRRYFRRIAVYALVAYAIGTSVYATVAYIVATATDGALVVLAEAIEEFLDEFPDFFTPMF